MRINFLQGDLDDDDDQQQTTTMVDTCCPKTKNEKEETINNSPTMDRAIGLLSSMSQPHWRNSGVFNCSSGCDDGGRRRRRADRAAAKGSSGHDAAKFKTKAKMNPCVNNNEGTPTKECQERAAVVDGLLSLSSSSSAGSSSCVEDTASQEGASEVVDGLLSLSLSCERDTISVSQPLLVPVKPPAATTTTTATTPSKDVVVQRTTKSFDRSFGIIGHDYDDDNKKTTTHPADFFVENVDGSDDDDNRDTPAYLEHQFFEILQRHGTSDLQALANKVKYSTTASSQNLATPPFPNKKDNIDAPTTSSICNVVDERHDYAFYRELQGPRTESKRILLHRCLLLFAVLYGWPPKNDDDNDDDDDDKKKQCERTTVASLPTVSSSYYSSFAAGITLEEYHSRRLLMVFRNKGINYLWDDFFQRMRNQAHTTIIPPAMSATSTPSRTLDPTGVWSTLPPSPSSPLEGVAMASTTTSATNTATVPWASTRMMGSVMVGVPHKQVLSNERPQTHDNESFHLDGKLGTSPSQMVRHNEDMVLSDLGKRSWMDCLLIDQGSSNTAATKKFDLPLIDEDSCSTGGQPCTKKPRTEHRHLPLAFVNNNGSSNDDDNHESSSSSPSITSPSSSASSSMMASLQLQNEQLCRMVHHLWRDTSLKLTQLQHKNQHIQMLQVRNVSLQQHMLHMETLFKFQQGRRSTVPVPVPVPPSQQVGGSSTLINE